MRRLVCEVYGESRGGDFCGMRVVTDEDDDAAMAEYEATVRRLKHRSAERMAEIDREIRAGATARAERRMARGRR